MKLLILLLSFPLTASVIVRQCTLLHVEYNPRSYEPHYITLWHCGAYGRIECFDEEIFRYAKKEEDLVLKQSGLNGRYHITDIAKATYEETDPGSYFYHNYYLPCGCGTKERKDSTSSKDKKKIHSQ